MRIATWNMNHWARSADQRAAAWALLQDLSLDVALVQEAVPPPGVPSVSRDGGIGKGRSWGSAVVSFTGQVRELDRVRSAYGKRREVDLLQTFPGSVAIAVRSQGQSIVFVSAYGVIEEGYAVTTMHRVLSDITPLLDREEGKNLIIGGDFNCSTQLPGRDRERHRNLFERFVTLGLVDLLALTAETRPMLVDCPCSDEPCRHVQTLRHARSSTPWHNDYIFATAPLADRLIGCQPFDDARAWALSDHCPVIAEFE
jgi:endonuclease/exonuclease/phosphatase family metal-dependent hydrolase